MPVTINGTTGIAGVDGSAGTPAVQGADTNTGVFFPAADTVAIATGGTEAMRVNSSQNVGIGTSSPEATLDVRAPSGGGIEVITPHNISAATSANLRLSITNSAGVRTTKIQALEEAVDANELALVFYTNTAGAVDAEVERMRITSSGNVLVGTTSMSVTSSLQVRRSGGNPVAVHNNGGTSGFFNQILFLNNAGTTDIGYIARTNDNSVAYNTTSDYRLKKDVAPMVGALAKVAALKPVTYKWKSDNTDGQGFIAHELQAVCPDAVTGEKDAVDAEGNPQYQGIDTSFLVATLTAAIQEQQALITSLTARIAALEGAAQ
jgi:hypothetical protein